MIDSFIESRINSEMLNWMSDYNQIHFWFIFSQYNVLKVARAIHRLVGVGSREVV